MMWNRDMGSITIRCLIKENEIRVNDKRVLNRDGGILDNRKMFSGKNRDTLKIGISERQSVWNGETCGRTLLS